MAEEIADAPPRLQGPGGERREPWWAPLPVSAYFRGARGREAAVFRRVWALGLDLYRRAHRGVSAHAARVIADAAYAYARARAGTRDAPVNVNPCEAGYAAALAAWLAARLAAADTRGLRFYQRLAGVRGSGGCHSHTYVRAVAESSVLRRMMANARRRGRELAPKRAAGLVPADAPPWTRSLAAGIARAYMEDPAAVDPEEAAVQAARLAARLAGAKAPAPKSPLRGRRNIEVEVVIAEAVEKEGDGEGPGG